MRMKNLVISIFLSILMLCLCPCSVMAAEFNPTFYANSYPDVVAVLGKNTDALYNHYVTYGMKGGRYPYAGAMPGEKIDGMKPIDASAAAAPATTSTFSPVQSQYKWNLLDL